MPATCTGRNIIAAGEQPYIVDLEGLFHSDPAYDGEVISEAVLNRRVVVTTVLATGLLPTPVGYLEQGVARISDLSGVSAPNQFTAQEVYTWQDQHTDRMRLRRNRVELPSAHNTVRIGDAPTALGEYASVLEDGFTDMYRLLLNHREELLAPDGPLPLRANGMTRVILRDTQFYSDVLDQTYHPDLLRDTADREHYLGQTLEAVLGIAGEERIIDSERRQLANGDIPVFLAGIGSTELGRVSEVITGVAIR
jgi:lantibiotic modifying enzyme